MHVDPHREELLQGERLACNAVGANTVRLAKYAQGAQTGRELAEVVQVQPTRFGAAYMYDTQILRADACVVESAAAQVTMTKRSRS